LVLKVQIISLSLKFSDCIHLFRSIYYQWILPKTSHNTDEADKYSVDIWLQKSVYVINSKQMFGLKTLNWIPTPYWFQSNVCKKNV